MTTDLVAFMDESKKPARSRSTGRVSETGYFYVVASTVMFEGELEGYRSQIATIEGELGFRLHYSDFRSLKRRVEAVEAILTIEGWEASVFEPANPIQASGGSPEHRIRAKELEAAFIDLSKNGGVDRAVLETRSEPNKGFNELDAKDHRVLQRLMSKGQVPAEFRISHAGKDEPLLSLADMVAGARTDMLCGRSDECYARLGHRVRQIHQVQ